MESLQIFELADKLKAAKEQKKELDSKVKTLGSEIDELDKELSDAMAESELEKFSRNGSTFYLSSRLYASPAGGRKDELILALKEHGCGDIVTETVNANTLASFCKEQMAENQDALPNWMSEVVNTFEKVSVGIRKS